MGIEVLHSLLLSLGLTLLLEVPFCVLLFRVRGIDIFLVVLVNVLTNPAVVLAYLLLKPLIAFPVWLLVAALELAAVTVEAICYKYCSAGISRPILMSATANLFSYSIGLIITHIF